MPHVIPTLNFDSRNLYSFALVGRLILTWFPSRPPALERPLRRVLLSHCSLNFDFSTICDPYLNLFRGIIPPLGNIDFSPILAFIVLNVRLRYSTLFFGIHRYSQMRQQQFQLKFRNQNEIKKMVESTLFETPYLKPRFPSSTVLKHKIMHSRRNLFHFVYRIASRSNCEHSKGSNFGLKRVPRIFPQNLKQRFRHDYPYHS